MTALLGHGWPCDLDAGAAPLFLESVICLRIGHKESRWCGGFCAAMFHSKQFETRESGILVTLQSVMIPEGLMPLSKKYTMEVIEPI